MMHDPLPPPDTEEGYSLAEAIAAGRRRAASARQSRLVRRCGRSSPGHRKVH